MPKAKQFGSTWWGSSWIEAMERIDYNTNRLSRGKSYARGEKVSGIAIGDSGKVTAKVKGSRPRPYKVQIVLKSFTPREKDTIKAIISNDPALAAELSMGRLPEIMLDLLQKNKISLFPTGWHDIDADCNCPDWASPCKHMAAIYYTIANEIDKDPLILFKLKNFDPDSLMEEAGFAAQSNTASNAGSFYASLFINYDDVRIIPSEGLSADFARDKPADKSAFAPLGDVRPLIDLSSLADKKECESVFALLSDNPLFYTNGNFKTILQKAYRNISDSIEKLEIKENGFSFKNAVFTLCCSSLSELSSRSSRKKSIKPFGLQTSFFITPHASVSGKRKFLSSFEFIEESKGKMLAIPQIEENGLTLVKKRGLQVPFGDIIDFFIALPYGLSAGHSSKWADFLNAAASVARALAGSSSFIPVVRSFTSGTDFVEYFYIVYKPLHRSDKLTEAIDYLISIMPQGFVFCPGEDGVAQDYSAVDELLTLILTYIVNQHAGIKIDESDKLSKAFFSGKAYSAERFEERQTAKVISNWLGWLNLKPVSVAPVVEIGLPPAGSEKFTLRIKLTDKRSPLSPMLLLREAFDGKVDELFSLPVELVREEVSRQLTVVGEHVPVLKSLLSYKGTKHANLSSENLVEFLTKGKHICSLLGIKAILPKSLLQIARPRIALSAKPKNENVRALSYLNLNDMLEFSWQVSIGDKNISAEEFRSLTDSASGIVKFHDQYLLVEPDSLKSILDALKEPTPRLSAMQTLQAAVTGEVSGFVFDPDLMLKQMIDALSAAKDVPIPDTLCAQLRPYQQRGFVWLYNNTLSGLGSCLADDMGLGKTIQVLTLLLKLKEEKWSKKPALVVCPTTLIGNWQKECVKFAPALDVSVYHGTSRELNEQNDLIITSYGMLRRDIDLFKKVKWSVAIIDEAQNIKNTGTDQTKAVKSLSAKSYIALSGTPVENRLMELWSIFDFINKDYLGKHKEFAQRFAYPIEKYKDEERIAKLLKATAPFMLRRLKSDRTIIKDLPPKIIKEQHCLLSCEQAALYQQTLQNLMREIEENEGIARKGLIFKLMTSLKQICNHPVQFTKKGALEKSHSGKAARALNLLDEAASRGEKTLVFTQYKEMGDLLESLIWDELQTEPLFFHGGLSRLQRDDMVLKFQQDESFPIMIVSLKAGGTGLNLTSATNVIHYDLWWNPAVEDQATDRAYRIGQNSTVMVNRLISLGTFEEKINEMMSAKRELAALTVAAGESGLSELSNQDLKELFNLDASSYLSAD